MSDSHRWIPKADGLGEHEDRGSRFLAVVFHAADEADFLERLAQVKVEHAKARHWCWAWRIHGAYRFNDDGEPGGPAGRAMLEWRDGSGLDEVGAICVRYFGGVKLGTGGLARAYGGATARAMDVTPRFEIVPQVVFDLTLPFDLLGLRDELTAKFASMRLAGDYTDAGWQGQVTLAQPEAGAFRDYLRDRTSNRARCELA